jgi:hypothetical protein
MMGTRRWRFMRKFWRYNRRIVVNAALVQKRIASICRVVMLWHPSQL